MYVADRPIQFKIEQRPGYKNFAVRLPCSEEWSDVHELPDYSIIEERIRFIEEFSDDPAEITVPDEFEGKVVLINMSEWPPEVLELVENAQQVSRVICLTIIGHTDPFKIFGVGDECLKALNAAKTRSDMMDIMPFDFVPVEINDEATSLRKMLKQLCLPMPDPEFQLEELTRTFDSENEFVCREPEFVVRTIEAAKKYITNYRS